MKMTAEELDAAKRARTEAEASFACENLFLTVEQRTTFERFEADRLSIEDRRHHLKVRWSNILAKTISGTDSDHD